MNNIEQYDELIEKFLAGKMTSEEEASFKDMLKNDSNLKEHAHAVTSLIMGLNRKKHKEESIIISDVMDNVTAKESFRVAATVTADDSETPTDSSGDYPKAASTQPNNKKVVKLILWPLSIAAICVILFNIFTGTGEQNLELFNSNYSSYSYDSSVRGDEDSLVVAQLTDLFNEINEKEDCSKQIESLEVIYKSLEKDYKYRAFANDIAWYLSLAYIKNNQLSQAKAILTKLVEDNPDTEISEKATELLKKIKDN